MKVLRPSCMALLLCITLFVPGLSLADKAGIPIDPDVRFDERAQNAIAAWNGTDEVLILSTDLRSATPGRLLEMLPLPSSPYEIKQGNISAFKEMIGLFNEKVERLLPGNGETDKGASGLGGVDNARYTGISITFSASIGAHNITVVHVEDQSHFVQWVQNFSAAMGVANLNITRGLNETVGAYLARGASYFVFDVVELAGDLRTLDPMVYKFKTDFLFYPLNITGAALPVTSRTDHRISVFLVMDGVLRGPNSKRLGNLTLGAGFNEYIQFTRSELERVSPDIGGLFHDEAFVCQAHDRGFGSADRVLDDIVIRPGDIRRPTADELGRQEFKVSIRPLYPSLAYDLLLSAVEPGLGQAGPFLAFMIASFMFAMFALGYLFSYMIEKRSEGMDGAKDWLKIYVIAASLSIFFVLAADPNSPGKDFSDIHRWTGGFMMGLVLLIPLGATIWMSKLTFKKRRVQAISAGMATAQALALLFLPNAPLAQLSGIFCFPSMFGIGILLLYLVLDERFGYDIRRRFRNRPRS